MNLTTHLQLECEELNRIDPKYEWSFFTRQLFAEMIREFGELPTKVHVDADNPHFVYIRVGDRRVRDHACNCHNVQDSLKVLKIEYKINTEPRENY